MCMVYFSVTLPKKFCSDTCSFCLHVPIPRQKQMYPKDDWLVNWCLTSQREYFTYFTPVRRYLGYVRICRVKESQCPTYLYMYVYLYLYVSYFTRFFTKIEHLLRVWLRTLNRTGTVYTVWLTSSKFLFITV